MRQLRIVNAITNREDRSLDRYLHEIGQMPMISIADEIMLAQKIRQGDQAALDRMVNANLRFVVSVAKQYQNQGTTLGDLINEGNLGLIKAALRFDETKGFKFISYAVWWIRQSVISSIAEQSRTVRLPLNQIGTLSKIKHADSSLQQQLEREPTIEELAEALEIMPEKISLAMDQGRRVVSFDAPFVQSKEDDGTLFDIIPNEGNRPDQALEDESLQYEVAKAIAHLDERESVIIRSLFGIDRDAQTLEEIGGRMGLTRERVRQIKDKALKKMEKRGRHSSLRAYA